MFIIKKFNLLISDSNNVVSTYPHNLRKLDLSHYCNIMSFDVVLCEHVASQPQRYNTSFALWKVTIFPV